MLKYLLLAAISDSTTDSATISYISDLGRSLMVKKRRGWLVRGIPDALAETVYVHSTNVRTAVSSYTVGREGFDAAKAWSMADIHDIAETMAEDYIPADRIPDSEKHTIEERVLREIASHFKSGDEMLSLWQEFEERKSPEAVLVFNADKLDASVKAVAYRNNFSKITDYYAANPLEPLLALYPGSTKDDVFDRVLVRLDEFHVRNREVLTLPVFRAALEAVVAFKEPKVFPFYFRQLMTPEAKLFLSNIVRDIPETTLAAKMKQELRRHRYFE